MSPAIMKTKIVKKAIAKPKRRSVVKTRKFARIAKTKQTSKVQLAKKSRKALKTRKAKTTSKPMTKPAQPPAKTALPPAPTTKWTIPEGQTDFFKCPLCNMPKSSLEHMELLYNPYSSHYEAQNSENS
ncbi:unnamed protein product [Bursaphelenchus okinawaensis]|uniref:Uncharacterized protein n=1 Tax=Bursaphelenchus okinawaensis TaxID=465554 RepID=A0A811KWX7_9BILA|nr:unnamed protein product [Bursaphelenchus okinawaensis]CAG9113530.1 unnamed protein product [Bursaphelenchus okinawaensis]